MSKNTWIIGAILVVVVGLFVGTALSGNSILDFLAMPDKTEQIEVSKGPWTKENNALSTVLSYESPAGMETNTISIKIDNNNVVTNFDMTISTESKASISYQNKFLTEMKNTFVGKKLSDISVVDTVAGASLTTKAFADAFAQL